MQCNEFDLCGVMPTIVAWMVRGFYWLCRGWLGWPFPSLHLLLSSLSPPPFAAAAASTFAWQAVCLVPLFPVASGFNRLFFFSPLPFFAGCSYVGLAHARTPCTPWSYLPSLTVTRSSPDRLVSSLPPLQSYPPLAPAVPPSCLLLTSFWLNTHLPIH